MASRNMFQQLKQRFFSHKSHDEAILSAKEIELIRITWSHLRSDIAGFKTFGADLFIRFFTQYPDYQRQFKSFKDVPVRFSDLPMHGMRVNKKLLAHGTYVMYTIGMLVDHLEDPETLEQMLKRLARNHYRRKVQITAFELLRDTFIEHLAEVLGPELFNKKAAIAWRKAFGYILSALDQEFSTLEIDVAKRGSYYQLNTAHRTARNDMIRSYVSSYRTEHHYPTHNRMLETRPSPMRQQQTIGLPPPSAAMRSSSVASSSSNMTSSASSTNTESKDSAAKRSFRFVFKPFKLVRKSLQSSSSSSKLDRTSQG